MRRPRRLNASRALKNASRTLKSASRAFANASRVYIYIKKKKTRNTHTNILCSTHKNTSASIP